MKCPEILKGKKSCGAELQTKRTMANGRSVRRERACPKCHARFWTEEQFEKDIQEEKFNQAEAICALDIKKREATVVKR